MTCLKRSFLLIAALTSGTMALAGDFTPRQDLVRLEQRVKAMDLADESKIPGVQRAKAAALMVRAEESFRRAEYLDAVRALNGVLNGNAAGARYLDAQFMLGRSYEELHFPARSIKAYLRYLANFANYQGNVHPRLNEVILRLLVLEESMLNEEREGFDRLLLSLLSFDSLKTPQKLQIQLMAAKSAYRAGKLDIAEDWLKKLPQDPQRPALSSEANFYLGMIALRRGQWDRSEAALQKVAEGQDVREHRLRQLARLNLARLFASRKMPQHAWAWYQRVEGPGETQRLAIYESVQLLVSAEDYTKARSLAETYIKTFPDTAEASALKERLGYLQLSSGKFDDAETQLFARQAKLNDFNAEVLKSYEGRFTLKAADIRELTAAAGRLSIESHVLNRADALNHRLEKVKAQIHEHQLELSSLQLTLGRLADASLRPELIAANQQIRNAVSELERIGEGMVSQELEFYKWTPAEQVTLVKSQARREKIMAAPQVRPLAWKTLYALSDIERRAADLKLRLDRQRASLATAQFLAKKGDSRQKDLAKHAGEHLKEIEQLNRGLLQVLQNQRSAMLAYQRESSMLDRTRKTFLLLTQEFLDTNALLEERRDRYPDPATKHVQEDFATNWKIWPRVAGQILTRLKARDKAEKDWLLAMQATHDKTQTSSEKLEQKEEKLSFELARASAKALPSVLESMRWAIDDQSARGKKWLGDVEWQRFLRDTQAKAQAEAQSRREQAKIQEDMKDLELERALYE